jgi:hypothetical protein
MHLTWRYGTGWYFEHFFRVLREEGRLLGLRCPACRRVYLPPRPVCGNCHAELSEWVPVADTGTVRAFTVVHLPIVDPTTGEPRPTPYGMALIQLDGADTTLNHYLAETDLSKLRIGLRVRAVWREERQGRMSDILHFEVVEEEAGKKGKTGIRKKGVNGLGGTRGNSEELRETHGGGGSEEATVVRAGVSLTFRYAAGKAASRFLAALRDEKRIYGTRCPECRQVLVPARSFCPRCGVDTDEWVEVGPGGTLTAFIVRGEQVFGLIRLDGADTDLVHRLEGADPGAWRVGMQVEAVFAQQRRGHILDIAYFKPAERPYYGEND